MSDTAFDALTLVVMGVVVGIHSYLYGPLAGVLIILWAIVGYFTGRRHEYKNQKDVGRGRSRR